MNIPNTITIARIVMVPVIVYLMIVGAFLPAFWLFILAGISDGIDGFIAKRFHQQTELGAYLDPLADKALLVSLFVTLGIGSQLPLALVILVVSRDILIIGAVLLSWLLERRVEISPLLVSKANTTLQIILVGAVLANLGFALQMSQVVSVLIIVVSISTIWSGASYMAVWARDMSKQEAAAQTPNQPKARTGKAASGKTARGEIS